MLSAVLSAVQVLAVFEAYDQDRSGGVDARELHTALYSLGLPSRGAEAEQILHKHDRDGSGALQLHEFRALVDELRASQVTFHDLP